MQHKDRWLIIAAVAAVVLATMWLGYGLGWSWLEAFDRWALHPLHEFGAQRPGWVTFWHVLCTVFGPGAFRLFGVVVICLALVQRNLRTTVFLLLTVEFGWLPTLIAKHMAHRPRPDGALVREASYSFPSGHALGTMASVLALLIVSAAVFGPWARVWVLAAGALIVIAVGVGRVVLNVHHPSDVLAGWALGYLWVLLWLLIVQPTALRPIGRFGSSIPGHPGVSGPARRD